MQVSGLEVAEGDIGRIVRWDQFSQGCEHRAVG